MELDFNGWMLSFLKPHIIISLVQTAIRGFQVIVSVFGE
jgi:hypothetical protein